MNFGDPMGQLSSVVVLKGCDELTSAKVKQVWSADFSRGNKSEVGPVSKIVMSLVYCQNYCFYRQRKNRVIQMTWRGTKACERGENDAITLLVEGAEPGDQ